MPEIPKVEPSPIFQDSLDGGRGQKTLQVTRAVNGFLIVEMTLVVGRDTLGLSHPIHRTVVADLCKTLSAWLESPESVMRGGEQPEFSTPNHDVSELWLPERMTLPK